MYPIFIGVLLLSFQIADGMDYLSSKNYVHRDLRAMNIFLTQSFRVKIGGLYLCSEIKDLSVSKGMVSKGKKMKAGNDIAEMESKFAVVFKRPR